MAESKAAPGKLELVREFVNSRDVDEDVEQLDSPDALAGWLAARDLLPPAHTAEGEDLERAVALREVLRAALLANNGGEAAPELAGALEDIAGRARLTPRFGSPEGPRLEPEAGGVDGALGRLVAVVAASMSDGTWSRLKVCPDDHCLWAFYDRTKNRSGVWCTMKVCGNRNKVRAYRSRQAG